MVLAAPLKVSPVNEMSRTGDSCDPSTLTTCSIVTAVRVAGGPAVELGTKRISLAPRL